MGYGWDFWVRCNLPKKKKYATFFPPPPPSYFVKFGRIRKTNEEKIKKKSKGYWSIDGKYVSKFD